MSLFHSMSMTFTTGLNFKGFTVRHVNVEGRPGWCIDSGCVVEMSFTGHWFLNQRHRVKRRSACSDVTSSQGLWPAQSRSQVIHYYSPKWPSFLLYLKVCVYVCVCVCACVCVCMSVCLSAKIWYSCPRYYMCLVSYRNEERGNQPNRLVVIPQMPLSVTVMCVRLVIQEVISSAIAVNKLSFDFWGALSILLFQQGGMRQNMSLHFFPCN
jgi:hypothetical protein